MLSQIPVTRTLGQAFTSLGVSTSYSGRLDRACILMKLSFIIIYLCLNNNVLLTILLENLGILG